MHWPKSSNMTKTCYHHMLFVGGVGFYIFLNFWTFSDRKWPLNDLSKVTRSRTDVRSYDQVMSIMTCYLGKVSGHFDSKTKFGKDLWRVKGHDWVQLVMWQFDQAIGSIHFPQRQNKIGIMSELTERKNLQKKEERILQRQNKTACLPSCKELVMHTWHTRRPRANSGAKRSPWKLLHVCSRSACWHQ